MKDFAKPGFLTTVCAIGGLFCLYARQWMLSTGVGPTGLIYTRHTGALMGWGVTAIVCIFLFLSLRWRPRCRICATPLSALGQLCAAAGFGSAAWTLSENGALFLSAATLLQTRASSQFLSLIAAVLGAVCCVMSLWAAVAAFRGKQPPVPAFFPAVVFFMLFLVCRYRQWSGEPELQRYLYQMLATVALLLTAYRWASMTVVKRDAWNYLPISRAALFFCLAAVADGSFLLLYGCMALSIAVDGCTPVQKKVQGEETNVPAN